MSCYSMERVRNRFASWDSREGEPRHDILEFNYFRRSRDDDGALQVAMAPAAQIQKEFQNFKLIIWFVLARVLHKICITCIWGR